MLILALLVAQAAPPDVAAHCDARSSTGMCTGYGASSSMLAASGAEGLQEMCEGMEATWKTGPCPAESALGVCHEGVDQDHRVYYADAGLSWTLPGAIEACRGAGWRWNGPVPPPVSKLEHTGLTVHGAPDGTTSGSGVIPGSDQLALPSSVNMWVKVYAPPDDLTLDRLKEHAKASSIEVFESDLVLEKADETFTYAYRVDMFGAKKVKYEQVRDIDGTRYRCWASPDTDEQLATVRAICDGLSK